MPSQESCMMLWRKKTQKRPLSMTVSIPSVLVQGRFNPVAVCGDMKKAFLQVRVKMEDCDSLRFHWKPGIRLSSRPSDLHEPYSV